MTEFDHDLRPLSAHLALATFLLLAASIFLLVVYHMLKGDL